MRQRLVLLGGQATAHGVMVAFLVVPASALFLVEYGAGALPWAYLTVAVAGVGVSAAMRSAQARLSLARLAQAVLATYALLVAIAWGLLAVADAIWVTFGLLVLFPVIIPVGFVLVGAQAGRLLDVRQMKAHLPQVFAGFSGGFALGGVLAAVLVGPAGGPESLLALDVVVAGVFLALTTATARRFPDELDAAPAPRPPRSERARVRFRVRGLRLNRLVLAVFGYQVLSAGVTQLLDFMVWERAAARYPDASDLARFQGLFGAAMNVVAVLFVLLVAGRLLTRWGVGWGLAANPAAVAALTLVGCVAGFGLGSAATAFFVLVCLQAVADIALTDGTTRTSVNASYQAVPAEDRLRSQTAVEAAGVPVALGLVGVFLLLQQGLGLDIMVVEAVTFVLALVWLGLAVWSYREYGAGLRRVLATPPWRPTSLRIRDADQRAAVDRLLASRDPVDVAVGRAALVDTGLAFGIATTDPPAAQAADVHEALLVEAERAARVLAALDRIDHHPHTAPLRRALHDELDTSARQAADVLALAHGREPVARALSALGSGVDQRRALALEMVEVTLGRSMTRLALGLVDPVLDDAGRAAALAPWGAAPVPAVVPTLATDAAADDLAGLVCGLVEDRDGSWAEPWLRACALYAAPALLGADAIDLARSHLDDPDPVVAETAAWALATLGAQGAQGAVGEAARPPTG